MLKNIWIDTETASDCDLKRHGTAVYAAHPSTRIQLIAWAEEDGPVSLWDLTILPLPDMPQSLANAFADPQVIFHAHNSWFDRNLIQATLNINIPNHRWRCTMAHALAHSLPAALADLGRVLGLPQNLQKHNDGRRLVLQFCKPNVRTGLWATPQTHPQDWQRYKEYCKNDVVAMRECSKRMPKFNTGQDALALWLLDQDVNDRGLQIDLALVNAALEAITKEQTQLAKRTKRLTSDEVQSSAQRDVLLQHILEEYQIALPNLQKATVARLAENPEIPEALRELLQVRLDTCTTSTAKYKRLLDCTSADGRIRGTVQFCGASRTGRDGHRLFQPGNLPRPTLDHKDILQGIDCLKNSSAALVGYEVMQLTSNALRYTIIAKPNHKLIVSDLSQIEARVIAWLANEQWLLDAYRAGEDIYSLIYSRTFQVTSVTSDQRFIGKVMSLALGFGGGVGALATMATSFNIDLEDLAAKILPTLSKPNLEEAESFYIWMHNQPGNRTRGLPKHVFVALDSLKRLYRSANPKLVRLWADAEKALRDAIEVPRVRFPFGKCYALRNGNWLSVVLPSGRSLCYPGAKIDNENNITYKGVDPFIHKWSTLKTYSGKICENATQAIARDIFKYGQLAAETAGYHGILPIHDEIVTEVPDTEEYTVDGLNKIMCGEISWADGLPLAASGFADYRYHK